MCIALIHSHRGKKLMVFCTCYSPDMLVILHDNISYNPHSDQGKYSWYIDKIANAH